MAFLLVSPLHQSSRRFGILRLVASVYIETTIISYLTAKPSRDLIVAAHQQITSEWWASVRQEVECFVSPFVIDEAARGDDEYARKRLEAIADFSVLEVNEEVEALARESILPR
jgi:hypothetical protein